jgi:hypothetical protein
MPSSGCVGWAPTEKRAHHARRPQNSSIWPQKCPHKEDTMSWSEIVLDGSDPALVNCGDAWRARIENTHGAIQ